ncbi:MAG: hypothetical protein M1821_003367 [Bathelium mastoideum]|nr:MAG: hypothetical protein M1821_003367 [Bathelium mastoideum]
MDTKYTLLDSKGSVLNHEYGSKPAKKWPGFLTIVLRAIGILLLLVVSLKFLHQAVVSRGGARNEEHFGGFRQGSSSDRIPQTVYYQLNMSQAWRNPDGGHWRPLFIGNNESPFPNINVNEGDLLKINIHNDFGLPTTVHWVGVRHKDGATWNDGSSGVTQYPILPRANWTSVFNTSEDWGLKWFLDHTSTPSVDGMYGTVWIRPSPQRPRPYHLINDDPLEIQSMMDAEESPAHLTVYNYQHKPMDWLLAQLQGEGYDPYCFNSVLVNGKGRVHCKPDWLEEIDGKPVDANGCVKQPTGAVAYPDCTPSDGDYEVIETHNRRWILLNFVNPGLEHPWRISIDNHDMWVIATDGGFVTPQKVQVLTLTNAERLTVLVRLDQAPGDYAIRVNALSRLQFIQTYAMLRYPHREFGRMLGEPMPRPDEQNSAMEIDGSVKNGFVLLDKSELHPYPGLSPPKAADITLRFRATGAPDPYNPYITNCSLNGSPWQIFRGLRTPLAMRPDQEFPEPNPIVKGLPIGSVVDIIVENDLPVAIPMYKHNDPTFRLGSGNTKFDWKDVADARDQQPKLINLDDPPLGYLHELPAGGWLAVRWKITQPAMTMFHAFRVRYFVLGMQVPMFEGDDQWPEVPEYVKNQPHVEFELPEHMGIFD